MYFGIYYPSFLFQDKLSGGFPCLYRFLRYVIYYVVDVQGIAAD
jgi:hypothetical protein